MWYLLSTFWFWLLLSAILGLVVGWMTLSAGRDFKWSTLLPWGIAIGIGGFIAIVQLLPHRFGYWLELGVLMLTSYVIGCTLACLYRSSQSTSNADDGVTPVAAVAVPAKVQSLEVPVEPAKPGPAPKPVEASEEAITGLSAARGGKGDDLTKIYGIDAQTQAKLNDLGLYHFDQIASLTPGNRRWLFRQLGYEGRFPSWWWRWRYDAEQILAGKQPPVGMLDKAIGAKVTKTKAAVAKPAPQVEAKPAPQVEAKPAPQVETKPVAIAEMPAEGGFEGAKPTGIASPRSGKGDDLKRIRGIGKQNEGRLHGLGIWHFDQIAAWTTDEVTWVGGYLAFSGRIEREEWVLQAKVLAEGGNTEFSKRADAGKVATSRDDSGDDGQANVASLGKDFGEKPKPGKPKADKT